MDSEKTRPRRLFKNTDSSKASDSGLTGSGEDDVVLTDILDLASLVLSPLDRH